MNIGALITTAALAMLAASEAQACLVPPVVVQTGETSAQADARHLKSLQEGSWISSDVVYLGRIAHVDTENAANPDFRDYGQAFTILPVVGLKGNAPSTETVFNNGNCPDPQLEAGDLAIVYATRDTNFQWPWQQRRWFVNEVVPISDVRDSRTPRAVREAANRLRANGH